jgi:predicted GNAT family acetyltransferase
LRNNELLPSIQQFSAHLFRDLPGRIHHGMVRKRNQGKGYLNTPIKKAAFSPYITSHVMSHSNYRSMDIQHNDGNSKGSFFIEKDGEILAEITYSKAGNDKIIIDHTEVSDQLRGKNVGKVLVEHAIGYARENKIKVIPLCPFARSVIERDESLQDVLS